MRAILLSSFFLACSFTTNAAASDEESCSSAHVEAQLLRRDHPDRLLERRAQLRTCSSNACPRSIVNACTKWRTEVDELLPGIVVTARDHDGAALRGVEISIDGVRRPSTSDASGTLIELDPGDHRLVVAAPGYRTEERKVVVRAREQRRATPIILTPMTSTGLDLPSPMSRSAETSNEGTSGNGRIVATYIAAGTALAGLGVGLWFTKSALDEKGKCPIDAGQTGCPEGIDERENDREVTRDSLVAGLGYGIAVAGAAVALVLWATGESHVRDGQNVRPAAQPRLRIGAFGVAGAF